MINCISFVCFCGDKSVQSLCNRSVDYSCHLRTAKDISPVFRRHDVVNCLADSDRFWYTVQILATTVRYCGSNKSEPWSVRFDRLQCHSERLSSTIVDPTWCLLTRHKSGIRNRRKARLTSKPMTLISLVATEMKAATKRQHLTGYYRLRPRRRLIKNDVL